MKRDYYRNRNHMDEGIVCPIDGTEAFVWILFALS